MQFGEISSEKEINFTEIFKYLLRKLGYIIAVALVFGVLGYCVTVDKSESGEYSAYSYIYVENNDTESQSTYETAIVSDDVLNAVIARTDVKLTSGKLRDKTTVHYNSRTGYSITVVYDDEKTAVSLSAGIAEQAVEHVVANYDTNAKVVVKADFAKEIDGSDSISPTVLATAAGFFVALFAFGCTALFDTSIKSTRDVERFGYGVIGRVSRPDRKNKPCCKNRGVLGSVFGYAPKQRCESVLATKEDENLNEEYRRLRAGLDYVLTESESKTVLLAPVGCGEDAAVSAVNLAVSLANSSKRTLVIDCNMRDPKLKEKLKISPKNTVSDVVLGDVSLDAAVINLKDRLDVLAAGSERDRVQLLDSVGFADLIKTAKNDYDFIILSATDMTAYADADILAKYSSGVVPIVKKFVTKDSDIEKVLSFVKISKANIFGFLYKE